MQERARVSSMDLKAHMNNLRKNPKFTEEIVNLWNRTYSMVLPLRKRKCIPQSGLIMHR